MTGIYEYWSLPKKLEIKCPSCMGKAHFEFARIAKITLKKDIEYFQQHADFEYERFQDSCGGYWHAAFYYPNLSIPIEQIQDLPKDYAATVWHSLYSRQSRGGIVCESCNYRQKHLLNWPNDAYYTVTYKEQVLWAFHREAALDLYHYLNKKLRDHKQYRHSFFLLHIPTIFKQKKARLHVTQQLKKLLL
ncbi:hypothetical protein NGC85_09800 [Acinetobacter sp. Z1]|uniref:hypothetical protein n=1 Tax=Acinetobacter sp. Z1 TaxID=2953738 RepID=UPI0020C833E6|nr:hypothetical protein [Acinetobacter sp. Z1]UTO18248.1 hypothetical protein NGC85_09800 [Acinetobacter sp. Z1]